MAKNYSIDYGAKDGPTLMDDDTGYEVGESPQEKTIRQLTNLKKALSLLQKNISRVHSS